MVKRFLVFALTFSLLHAQTVLVPIPGQPQPKPQPQQSQGSGGSDLGAFLGGLLGVGLLFLLTKAVFSKPSKPQKMAFVPFEFIALHKAELPEDLKVIDRESFEGYTLSLIRWEEDSQKLEEKTKGKVLLLEPNYLYELYGNEGVLSNVESKEIAFPSTVVALLDTGVDENLLGHAILFVRNIRRDSYKSEKHGTAVAYLAHEQKGAKLAIYRVCSEGVCDGWSVAKALIDVFKEGIKIVNMSFGTDKEDKIVAFIIKGMSLKGFVFVAPVGNNSSDQLPFPARLEEVISVAGKPCFPERICIRAKAKEEYKDLHTPVGKVTGTSFSSAIHAGKMVSN
ncbi:MAG: S8/S53 family peptidase [Hydrogenobacter sp.]